MSDTGMKYSLRDVFFRDVPESDTGDTARLLERYGIVDEKSTPDSSEPVPPATSESCLLEKIENRILQGQSKKTQAKEDGTDDRKAKPRRDDLALVRWRKMAGL